MLTFLLGAPLLYGPALSLTDTHFDVNLIVTSIIWAPLFWWISAIFPKMWFVTLIPTAGAALLVWYLMRDLWSRFPTLFEGKIRTIFIWTLGSALVSLFTAAACDFTGNGVSRDFALVSPTPAMAAPIGAILGLSLGIASVLDPSPKLRRTLVFVCAGGLVLVGAAFIFSLIPSFYELDGPPIHVKVDSTSLCVERRFISPGDLEHQKNSPGPLNEWYAGKRVTLSLYSRDLVGQTNEQYAAARKDSYGKTVNYGDWVGIEIIPERRIRRMRAAPTEFMQFFEESWHMDAGFRAHRRRRDCAEQSYPWLGFYGVTLGPKCLDTVLLYGNTFAPETVFQCDPERCWMLNGFSKDGVNFKYSIPRMYLEEFPAVHAKAFERVAQWRSDTSCHKESK